MHITASVAWQFPKEEDYSATATGTREWILDHLDQRSRLHRRDASTFRSRISLTVVRSKIDLTCSRDYHENRPDESVDECSK